MQLTKTFQRLYQTPSSADSLRSGVRVHRPSSESPGRLRQQRMDYATKFKITEETLLSLAAVGVPEPVTAKLKPMKEQEFDSQDAFLRALSGTLDDQELKLFRNQVLNHTDRTKKEIEFHNVCFSYQPGKPTLENISFKVRAGRDDRHRWAERLRKNDVIEFVAAFLRSGSWDEPDRRHRFADARTCAACENRSALSRRISILFDDTIYNNIAYGSPGATTEEIEAVAKNAFAHEFIMEAPLGYQTQIGEMRVVSGGEKQRIALARAMLRDPSILILDELPVRSTRCRTR